MSASMQGDVRSAGEGFRHAALSISADRFGRRRHDDPGTRAGDLFFVVCGPGEISTAVALVGVAKAAGAAVVVVTAQPQGRVPGMADYVLTVPAQTMADDQGAAATSVLPMGSLFEGALFVLFEVMVLKLKTRLGVSPEAMRANHTNME